MDFRLKKTNAGIKVIPTTPRAKEWLERLASAGPYPGLARGPIAGLYFWAGDEVEAAQFHATVPEELETPDPFSL